MLIKVQKSWKLDVYRRNEKLNESMKNYEVKMGFGLHMGWSIEGAIGSSFKIDASYLSSNVNLSNKLEENTKEYYANLIISEEVVKLMTPNARSHARKLDRIQLGESDEPMSRKLISNLHYRFGLERAKN